MSNADPKVVWYESEQYVDELTFEHNPDDGTVASFAYWRVRVDNHRSFPLAEQAGILMGAMFFGPPEDAEGVE